MMCGSEEEKWPPEQEIIDALTPSGIPELDENIPDYNYARQKGAELYHAALDLISEMQPDDWINLWIKRQAHLFWYFDKHYPQPLSGQVDDLYTAKRYLGFIISEYLLYLCNKKEKHYRERKDDFSQAPYISQRGFFINIEDRTEILRWLHDVFAKEQR